MRRHYPDLDTRLVYELADLQIRYLELDASRMALLKRGVPVGVFVFPRYRAGVGLEQRRLSATEALASLFQAPSKLDLRPELLAETLRWVESVPAYELIYGDLDWAIEWVMSRDDGAGSPRI